MNRLRMGERQNGGIDQPVMNDKTGTADQPRRAQRQQVGIARPSADKIDCASLHDVQMAGGGLCHQREWVAACLGEL